MKQQNQIIETNESINYHDEQEYDDTCVGHEYEYLEMLPSRSEQFVEKLFVCVLCSRTKAVKIYHGVRD
jgi:hypothetical protein